MMMETVVYAREYLYIKELYDTGELGKLQFLQASHMQDMDGWPDYWPGLPPMWYATHCVGPMLALTDATAEIVSCFGSGTIREDLIAHYGSPVRGRDRARQVPGLRPHRAHLPQPLRRRPPVPREHRRLRLQAGVRMDADRGRASTCCTRPSARSRRSPRRSTCRTSRTRLPEEIQRFTTKGVYDDEETHLSFTQGAGHGGSHPHLVHEFVSALAESARAVPERPPLGELDVRRPVRARVRAQGRRARAPARVHPAPARPSSAE